MKTKEKAMHDQNFHKNHCYNTFVQTLTIEQNEIMTDQMNNTTDNVVEVHHETTNIPIITLHRTDIVLRHEIEIIMTEEVFLKMTHVIDLITTNKNLDPIVPLIEHTDHFSDVILVLDIDPILFPETTFSQTVLFHIDLLQDQEILDFLDPPLTLLQEITLIPYKPN